MVLIDRYFIVSILQATLLVALVLLSLYSFISFIQATEDIGRGNFTLFSAFQYTLFTLPRRLYELFPFSVLLGTLLGVGMLNSNSELIAVRAAGVTVFRMIISILKAGLILALFMILLGEYIVPVTENIAQRERTKSIKSDIAVEIHNEVWIRDGNTFTNIRSILEDNTLSNIEIFAFDDNKRLLTSTSARRAYYQDDAWVLEKIKQSIFLEEQIEVKTIERARWSTLLDLELVDVIVSELENLSAHGLLKYANYLDENGLESRQYWLAFWNKMIQPLSMLTMVLLAIPFAFDTVRAANTGSRIVIGVLLGVGFTIGNQIAAQLGLVYGLFPILSASAMTIITFVIAFYLIKKWV